MTSPTTSARRRRKRRTTSTEVGIGGAPFQPNPRRWPVRWTVGELGGGTDPLAGGDEVERVAGVARDEGGRAAGGEGQPLAAEIHEDGAAAGAVAGLDVVQDVASEPGRRQVEIEVASGAEQQPRRRLAAVAGDRQLGDDAIAVVRAVVDAVQPDAIAPQLARQVLVHAVEVVAGEVAAGEPGLVRDDDEAETG